MLESIQGLYCFDTDNQPVRKVFLSQRSFVDSPANLLHKRHSGRNRDKDTTSCIFGNA